jgi:hypothetical protein
LQNVYGVFPKTKELLVPKGAINPPVLTTQGNTDILKRKLLFFLGFTYLRPNSSGELTVKVLSSEEPLPEKHTFEAQTVR